MFHLVRAFGLYFHLNNLAEQNFRLSALRRRESGLRAAPYSESIEDTLRRLRAQGVPPEVVRDLLDRLLVWPVFTAHPTEARRPVVLAHLRHLDRLVARLDSHALRLNERQTLEDELLAAVTLLWQTEEVREQAPTPLDEAAGILDTFIDSVYAEVPHLQRDLDRALAATYPEVAAPSRPFLRFSSWVGGDRDGNPNVTAPVTLATLRLHRDLILDRYIAEVEELAVRFSQSARRVGVSAELGESLAGDAAALPDASAQARDECPNEPYCQKLRLIRERLRLARRGQTGGYAAASTFAADLDLLARSLRANDGARLADGPIADLRLRLAVFGFYLANLEVRQHSAVHSAAVAEVLTAAGVPGYEDLSETGRQRLLLERLQAPDSLSSGDPAALSAQTQETLATFDAIATLQAEARA